MASLLLAVAPSAIPFSFVICVAVATPAMLLEAAGIVVSVPVLLRTVTETASLVLERFVAVGILSHAIIWASVTTRCVLSGRRSERLDGIKGLFISSR